MDLAYDHIAEQSLLDKESEDKGADDDKRPDSQRQQQHQQRQGPQQPPQHSSLNEDLQEAYRAISTSAWGSRLGGFFGHVVKQVEPVYREASQELTSLGADASRGVADLRSSLVSHTRSLSLATTTTAGPSSAPTADDETGADVTPTGTKELTPEEAAKQSETVMSRLRAEAAKRLKDIQRAEDAADEALLKFGSNLRNFLRDAVSVAAPTASEDARGNTVLFESKDASGKRVIHTSRYDAQLHVIHTTTDSFTQDPPSAEFESWAKEFDVEKKTEDISADLAKYPEIKAAFEKLSPDQVPYAQFWTRYYFLRHSIETAEARRRDLLKAASAEEEVEWDEDSDDETTASKPTVRVRPASAESSTTIQPPEVSSKAPRPSEPRKSNDEKSQPDSDTSYDVVGAASGNPSHAPNSPKGSRKGEDSDEDWE